MNEQDTRDTIQLEISDEDFLTIAKMAHEQDITFNQMVEHILWEQIKRQENG